MIATIAWALLFIFLIIFGIFSIVLLYYWKKYSIIKRMKSIVVLYFSVSILLFIIMLAALSNIS